MAESNLQEQLKELRKTLDTNPQLDSESLVLLQKVAADIEAMELEEGPDIRDLVHEKAVEFEQDYPTLAIVLRQLVQTLGRMGI